MSINRGKVPYIHAISHMDVAKRIFSSSKKRIKKKKTGDFLVAFFFTSHMIFLSSLSLSLFFCAYQASCLYDMIPPLFLFSSLRIVWQEHTIFFSIHIHAMSWELNEMLNGIFYCVFHPADSRSVHNFFLVCTYSVCGKK